MKVYRFDFYHLSGVCQVSDKYLEVEMPCAHFGGKQCHRLGVVVLTCNPSTQEA